MQNKVRTLLLLLSLPLVVLSTVNCDSAAALCSRTQTIVTAKVGDCGAVTYSDSDRQKCEQSVSKCSADDRQKISNALDCFDKLEVCVSGNELSWILSFGNCSGTFGNLSTECKAAFEISASSP